MKRERSIEIPGTRVWREPLVWVTGGIDLRQDVLPLPAQRLKDFVIKTLS